MRRLIYSDAARQDLLNIADYVIESSGSSSAGEQFLSKLESRCRKLASLPGTMGRPRPELGQDFRSIAFGNYVIFFRYEAATLRIINILEGHRDLDGFFSEDQQS